MEDILGFVFACVFLIVAVCQWIWIVFKSGSDTWRDSIIKWDRVLGKKTKKDDFMLKPIIFKFFSTLFFIFSLFFFYAGLKAII